MGYEALFLPFENHVPHIHPDAYIAPGVIITGEVTIHEGASVFPGCVLRGDWGPITIGRGTNIQDGTISHADDDAPVVIGDEVTVGHAVLLHGTRVGDGSLIGMGSRLLSHSVIGAGSLVAAGAVVLEHAEFDDWSMVAGLPAKPRRETTVEEREGFRAHAAHYRHLASLQAGVGERLSRSELPSP